MNMVRSDEGLTLLEVLLAMSISAMLTLGVGQMFILGVKAMQYSETNSSSTVKKTTLTRVFADDTRASISFYVAGASPGTATEMQRACTSWPYGNFGGNAEYNATVPFTDFRPLLTLEQGDGSLIGYEVRKTGSGGELWRVRCTGNNKQPSADVQMLLLTGVAAPTAATDPWRNAFACTGDPSVPVTYSAPCPTYTSLSGLASNLGIKFTLPPAASISLPVSSVTGSRSGL